MSVDRGTVAVQVRYFAAARAAAGHDEETVEIGSSATVGDLESALGRENPALAQVLRRCTYLRDSVAVRDRSLPVAPCAVIEVLPPFAGG
ncbi:MoaD/ThiS family protein [Williamsia herbipolensis]|uniref:MoaD/ThiS family protein n=1 Tax=Williamsia herbipolensis TaxID=1603258 RepID=UPI000A5EE1A2